MTVDFRSSAPTPTGEDGTPGELLVVRLDHVLEDGEQHLAAAAASEGE